MEGDGSRQNTSNMANPHRRRPHGPAAGRDVRRVLLTALAVAVPLAVSGIVWRAEAAPAPILLSATASDASAGGAGVQAAIR